MRQKIGLFLLKYLRFFAKLQLAKIKPDIIGITGSTGKSSVRDAIYLVLKQKYKCKVSGKANSESGIPLDILGLEMKNYSLLDWIRVSILAPYKLLTNWEKYDKYVVEMGIDSPYEPKNMTYLLSILKPRIGVFINASLVHSESFDGLVMEKDSRRRKDYLIKLIAKEKAKLIQSLPKDGYAVINWEDENVKKNSLQSETTLIGVFSEESSDLLDFDKMDMGLLYKEPKISLKGFSCKFVYFKGKVNSESDSEEILMIKNKLFGQQYCITFAMAISVGLAMGLSLKDCINALENYKAPPGRMSLISGINDSYIIDSSYNASQGSVIDALKVLEVAGEGRKKIAVLGDMREIGLESESAHNIVARAAVKVADKIVLVGPLMKDFFIPEARKLGYETDNVLWFENSLLAGNYVKDIIETGDVILVKGSQNEIYLERVVEEIMQDKTDADNLLCRRGEYWDVLRSNYV